MRSGRKGNSRGGRCKRFGAFGWVSCGPGSSMPSGIFVGCLGVGDCGGTRSRKVSEVWAIGWWIVLGEGGRRMRGWFGLPLDDSGVLMFKMLARNELGRNGFVPAFRGRTLREMGSFRRFAGRDGFVSAKRTRRPRPSVRSMRSARPRRGTSSEACGRWERRG